MTIEDSWKITPMVLNSISPAWQPELVSVIPLRPLFGSAASAISSPPKSVAPAPSFLCQSPSAHLPVWSPPASVSPLPPGQSLLVGRSARPQLTQRCNEDANGNYRHVAHLRPREAVDAKDAADNEHGAGSEGLGIGQQGIGPCVRPERTREGSGQVSITGQAKQHLEHLDERNADEQIGRVARP